MTLASNPLRFSWWRIAKQRLSGFYSGMAATTHLFLSLCVVVAFFSLGKLMPFSTLAVMVGLMGGALAMQMLQPVLQRHAQAALDSKVDEMVQAKLDREREHMAHEENQKAMAAMRQQLTSRSQEIEGLEQELAALKTTQMSTTQWAHCWEMVLLEVQQRVTNWREHTLSQTAESTFNRGETLTYRGLLQKSFKAKVGIRLEKLKLLELGADRLRVTRPEFCLVGVDGQNTEWLHKHVERSVQAGTVRAAFSELHDEHPMMGAGVQAQLSELEQRLNQGSDVSHLEQPVVDMACRILQAMLAPLGRKIEFVEALDEPGLTLNQYLEAQKAQAEARILAIQRRQSELCMA